ncbi:PREDICTED: inactive serine/threonine-protein kinase TEX14 [Lepidothrix coronata]|uniref:Inactive serine/threonine-protein kinase TEX14 n=1 Tax=Lepidothrix coronata TaxID=321398 RepID=A0A6J0HSQ1_9PASS|nr:PREDICTED: inactive serine/threonine-protein kinase TEX14 [Lepidothrix coronata]XP_017677190.1 PREDICTED: inactive serine/threonine-protein kinase TEX14 [Lepidothrix coronata]
MAHPVPLPFPCPVQLGSIKGDSLEAELHDYVREGNYVKVKKLLKKGVLVDAVNSMGQTCLFTAALLGLSKIVDVLLDYGSDANHRCLDGSTPVHAAAFSGNQWILSKLLDEGGDLRAHDKDGRTPQHWALSARKECSAQMLEFIQQCTLHMQAAIQNFPSDLLRKVGSSKALVSSPSRFGGLVQGNIDSALGRLLKGEANVAKNIYSFGFGKFYLAGNGHLGYLASLPIIGEKEVVQADDEPAFSYHVGPFMIMTNLVWGGSRVTVKELGFQPPQHSWKLRLADLLLAEQEHSSKLRHPHLLQLMSVCLSSDLEKTRLVYERVHFGSLYSILHERRTEFPVLQTETILHVLLQVIDALRFLHSRGFIHRSLSSYAIQIVSAGEAKLCNLEYMIQSKDSGEHSDLTRIPVPVQLYRWCSPEVALERTVTVKSDVYSFCAVLQEALTESPPWKGFEDSVIKQLMISGEQLEADVRLPMLYYDVVKSGLEPKQRNRSMKLQDIQYILKNDLKDLVKSQSGHADDMSKARRPAVFADVNICWASAFSCQRRTVEFKEKETATADGSPAPRDPVFREVNRALVVQEASTSVQPVAQDKSPDVASEVQATPSESDVDESLCSFEINEIFATYPDIHQDFLEGGSGLDQTLKDAERQQKEEDKSPLGVLSVSSGASCEDEEDSDSSESGSEFTAEEEEEVSEASDLAQGRGGAGRRGNSPSPNEQHISKCVLNIKIIQSMLQQAADSLCRTEENLDRLKAIGKQKKLLQKIRMSQLSKQSFQEGHCNRSDDASQDTNHPFCGVNTFLPKAVGPPSSDCIPPPMTCQAQGALGEDNFQAVSKTARETQAVQNEKRKSKIENNHRDLGCSVRKSLDDQMNLNHERLLPRGSARCQKKLNLQGQRGADSHPAARSEEWRWSYSKPRSEFYSEKITEERRMMQPDWRTEVKRMARRVASGELELSCPCPASEGTSESEAESAKEPFQHVTARAPKRQAQQRCMWQPGDDVVPWNPGREERTESEESDLESALRSSAGRGCQLPSQDEQAESGIAIHKNSVLPQQVENLSRGHSRELHCSLSSPPDVSEEFFTPDYFLPPEGSSELETSDTEGKSEDACAGFLQKLPKDAKSSVQTSGGKRLFCSTGTQKCGSNKLGVSRLSQMPVVSVDAAREAMLWEPQEGCQEKDVSVADSQDLSSIPCEQENFPRDVECKTPRLCHAPTSVSTPLGSEEKVPLAFEKYKHCHELASDFSLCGSQEASSTMFKTFTTAYEGERSMEIPGAASRVCQFELKEPDGLPPVVPSLRNTRQAPALSEASQPSIDELPPPVQELLDEIELLKQQDSITPDLKEVGLQDCGVQMNVPNQIRMESRESEEESERNEKQNQSSWTKESFTLAEDTERAHSTLDDILERMLHAVPGDEEIQEQPRGHTLGAASLQDPEDAGRKNGVEERGAGAGGRAPESCAGTSADKHPKDQTSHLQQQQLSSASPFRIIVLDESSLCD